MINTNYKVQSRELNNKMTTAMVGESFINDIFFFMNKAK
jgi:hypothetical protein